MSINSAAGFFGSPGISIISPAIATINPAPADILISFIFTVNPSGRPRSAGLSESDFCVFDIHTGKFPYPSFSSFNVVFPALS